jgi:SAM-dependent methyltransferase
MLEDVRAYWDADARTYDDAPNHLPTSPAERTAWATAMARLLPQPPARILDCGAGTGFLSLIAARLGHKVTAVDVSTAMLAKLRDKAAAGGLGVEIVEGGAEQPPAGPFDAVMERHLLWTLTDPIAALRAWREVAPVGRLVLVEGAWGRADPFEVVRGRGREMLRRLRKKPADHHGRYPEAAFAELPLGRGTSPSAVVECVTRAGWPGPSLERLRDVEWAAALDLPLPERLLGVPPRFVVTAG